MSLLVVHTPDNVLKTSVASEHAGKFVCLLKKLVASGYPIKDIGGYSYRKIFGTNYLSLHAYGKALDINQVRYNEVTVSSQNVRLRWRTNVAWTPELNGARPTPVILKSRPTAMGPVLPGAKHPSAGYSPMHRAKYRNSGTGAFTEGRSIDPRSNRLKTGFLVKSWIA